MKHNRTGELITHEKIGEGIWRVTSTAMTGGGTGHGPHDIYPDGHELTLMRDRNGVIDWSEKPRKFYQSGFFERALMLPYCDPITQEESAESGDSIKSELIDCLDDCRGVLQSFEDQLQGKSGAVTAVLQKAIKTIKKAIQTES